MTQSKKGLPSGTRERMLEAAIDVFGKHGFESATTRMIAKEARVNIAAIPYYFGGKKGLYHAVVQHVVEHIQNKAGDLIEQVAETSFTGDNGRHKARELMKTVLERFIEFVAGTEQGQRFSRLILREQTYPSDAYSIIFKGFLEPFINSLSSLIIAASGEPSPRRAKLRALSVMGQVLIFRVARETIVRSLDLEGYSPGELEEVRDVLVSHTMAILDVKE